MNTIAILIVFVIVTSYAEKIRYISTEQPKVTYSNPKYVSFLNLTSKRYGRSNPFYYVGLNYESKVTMDNNFTVDFYFYELLTNQYKPGFIEMHFKLCDLIEKDMFFGSALRQGKAAKGCPLPKGVYNFSNMTVPLKHIPRNFPFTKGRIYCNITHTYTKELVGAGYINMEIKETNLKRTVRDSVEEKKNKPV